MHAGDQLVAPLELQGGDVHRDTQRARPLGRFGAGAPQHPASDRADQADLLGNRNECSGRDHAAIGMRPSQQRFEADQHVAGHIVLRLEMQRELSQRNGTAQIALQRGPRLRPVVHRCVEHACDAPPFGLGLIECEVGTPDHLVAITTA